MVKICFDILCRKYNSSFEWQLSNLVLIYRVGTIVKQFSALSLNSAVSSKIRPFGFKLIRPSGFGLMDKFVIRRQFRSLLVFNVKFDYIFGDFSLIRVTFNFFCILILFWVVFRILATFNVFRRRKRALCATENVINTKWIELRKQWDKRIWREEDTRHKLVNFFKF